MTPTQDLYSQTVALVRLAVERVAADPEDEQRYLELNFALDRAVERNLRYQELLGLFEEGVGRASPDVSWAWRLAVGLSANLMGDAPAAVRCLEAAQSDLERAGRVNTAAAAFLQGELARACYHLGNHSRGVETATRALQLARAANSSLAEAYAHHYLGLISIRQRDYDFARRQLTAAHDLFERMNQRQGRARVMDSLAVLAIELGHYDTAGQLLHESLDVKEELHDIRGQALTCGNLALLYTALGEFSQALRYLDREREITSRVGDERNATLVRVQLGSMHLRHGNPVLAREELLAACALARQRSNDRLEAIAAFTLAEAERQLGNHSAALESITRACSYFTTGEDAVMRDRAALRRALLEGQELEAPAVQEPLDRLRTSPAPTPLADALFEAASFFHERGRVQQVTALYAEALDIAEPAHAAQFAALLRSRTASAEGRAWVDAMMTVKQQKDRLEKAYAELRREESLREALTQMIVHDLKNPLTVIIPWLQTIEMGEMEPDETAGSLRMVIDECDYLLRMIDDLNDAGKMQHAGKLELSREPVDLSELIADVARRLQRRAQEAGMRICLGNPKDEGPAVVSGQWSVVSEGGQGQDGSSNPQSAFRNPQSELPPVVGDRNKLRRVIENLVANAIKYGRPPEDTGRRSEVWIAAIPEPPSEGEPGFVRVEVADFGVGIPVAEAERVFEPYYQAEAGRKRKAGVGLGLAFCRMVVEAHDGSIWTQPNPPSGSIFAFRLPAASGVER
jgi:signal transduction histidine kinase